MNEPHASGNQKPFILYADDDADDRTLLSMMFKKIASEYEVRTVTNGLELLNNLNKMNGFLPCLVILDMNMPELTGRQIIEKLKMDKKFSSLPLVIFTTSANPSEQSWCEAFGIHMITKPCNLLEMEAVTRQFVSFCNTQNQQA